MTLYSDLGISESADAAEIKRAYKRRASKAHPDKGGKAEDFQQLQRAYAVLSDESRRARYDSTGAETEAPSIESAAQTQLAMLFIQLVEQDAAQIFDKLRNILAQGKQAALQQSAAQSRKVEKLLKAKTRLKKKSPGLNFLSLALDGQIKQARAGFEMGQQQIAMGEKMARLLDEYEFEQEADTSLVTAYFKYMDITK